MHTMRAGRFIALMLAVTGTAVAQTTYLPGQGPRLAEPRVTQADIESGALGLKEIRHAGMVMFTTPFNKADGYGDGPVNPLDTRSFGGRPTLQNNGTFLRVNGLDAQACLECHSVISNATVPATLGIGGAGGSVSNAMFMPTVIDVADFEDLGHAFTDGRFINPPFLFGSGGVELLAQEMTVDLQALRAQALASPGIPVELVTKGVHFGTLVHDGSRFDYSGIAGIDHDLVVRPFGRKGEFATVRNFGEGAMMFHFGMQPVETVGDGIDADGDGVANEVLIGELSALAIFGTTLEHPVEDNGSEAAATGKLVFGDIGCASCHKPSLTTRSRSLNHRFPEDHADPATNVFYSVDLSSAPAGFPKARGGGIVVPLYADLKRHDMGPGLAETFGSPLDAMFTTARLWGVADTAPYLHDGRALTLDEAIRLHGGEAQSARDLYVALPDEAKGALIEFLLTLRTPRNPLNDMLDGKNR